MLYFGSHGTDKLMCFAHFAVTPRATATKSSLLEQAVSDTAKQVNIAAASNEVSEKILESRKLKSVDLVERHMRRIREVQPVINAVVDDRYEEAETEAADQLVASGTLTPEQLVMDKPFLGVPLSTKDCYAVKGMLQDSGLVLRKGFRAPQDADGMALLRAASAIPPALTNISELCMWWESYNLHERTNNPYDSRRICGRSSGGEGSLIASAGSVIGVGTDISGSIRMLAFFNGIFDHKPTRGLVSNKGQYPPARDHSLDACLVAGPMCRYAQDLEPMLAIMAGPRASLVPFNTEVDWSKVTVYYRVYDLGGTLCTPVHPEMKDCVARNIRHAHGSPVVELALEEFRYSAQIFTARLAAAAVPSFASELALLKGKVPVWRELECFLLRCSPHTLPALALCLLEWLSPKRGHPALTRVLARADTLRDRLAALLGAGNAIFVYPSHPEPATFHYQPLLKPFNYAYTAISNVLGYPTCQCPVGISPLGVQVVAAFYKDHLCLDGAREVEKAFCGLLQPPRE
ncbi:LOW QUALITY PROTEIN: fatty-acid amide hydrolase 2-A-like [Dermacentor silvarum]|uniref:LOW QUALITY PROTEIN: fatty-acid amide hydrolase 2-A-like n=1 Tax=Dermacentor silvarum TaxID=543639 RepID=UPI002100B4DA|nr:LOW QUALITY PROTEIN: fatty-acid amide hydrolase 2-A-like [Dermacentor silvarum]